LKKHNATSKDVSELRRKAEELLYARGLEVHPSTAEADVLRLNHELQVHQIELEMQNEQLQKAQTEAVASLEQYTDLYNFAPVGYFTIDRDSFIRNVNLSGISLLGVERSSLLNRHFGAFVSSDTLPVFNIFLKRVFELRTKEACGIVLLIEDGSNISVQIKAAFAEDSEDCLIAVTDITVQKQEEITLQKKHDKLQNRVNMQAGTLQEQELRLDSIIENTRCIIESSRDIIAIMDTDYRYILFNNSFHDEFQRIFGVDLKAGDSLPKAIAHLPDDIANAMEYWKRALSGEDFIVTQQFGDTFLERHWYELHFSPIRGRENKIVGALHIVHNITERKQAEAALQQDRDELENRVIERTTELQQTNSQLQVDIAERKQAEIALTESEERFRRMFERHSAIKLVIDPDTGDIIDANEAAAKFYGWSVEQLKQMRIQQINTLPSEILNVELEKAKSHAQISFEFRHRIADGSIRDVEVFSNRIDISGKSFLYSIIHDITDRKEAQQALAHIAERDRHISEIFQQTAMPRCIPTLPECYEIATKYQPALQEADVCGDFYDIFELDDGNIGITIGDIIGKGLPAALRITAARNMIRSYAFLYDSPAKVMALVNDALCKDIAMESDMLTAFYAVLDTRNHTLTYSNAGHEPPLMRYSNGNIEPLELCGPMFYGMRKQIYSEVHIDFQENDVLVMVTDGISEASIDRSSDLFGAEGIIRCLSTNATSSTEQIATAILEDATYFANGILHDDASIVVIKKISDQ